MTTRHHFGERWIRFDVKQLEQRETVERNFAELRAVRRLDVLEIVLIVETDLCQSDVDKVHFLRVISGSEFDRLVDESTLLLR